MANELFQLYWKCRILLQEFNHCKSDDIANRKNILGHLIGEMAAGVWIEAPFYCDYGKNISIGENTFINFNCVFLDAASITIGKNVLIAPNVQIYTASHPTKAQDRIQYENEEKLATIKVFSKPILIGDNVWIGGNSVILPGVTIGNNVTVGAGSVVSTDLPNNVLAIGNPCRIVKQI